MSESAWTSTRRSAGVTCAAALAILGSVTALLVWGNFILNILNSGTGPDGKYVYETHPYLIFSLVTVPFFLIASGIRTGIGLFQLKSWARHTALVWAGVALCFSLWIIALRPYETFLIPERFVSDLESLKQLLALSLVIATLPVSIWWIFLFRLKSVRQQFEPLPASETAAEANPT